jgi:hypothetical protein
VIVHALPEPSSQGVRCTAPVRKLPTQERHKVTRKKLAQHQALEKRAQRLLEEATDGRNGLAILGGWTVSSNDAGVASLEGRESRFFSEGL